MVRGFAACLMFLAVLLACSTGSVRSGEASSAEQIVCVSLVTDYHSATGEVAAQGGIELFDNGSASLWYITYDLPDDNLAADHNESWWAQPGTDFFDDVLTSMAFEGFWWMEGPYVDARRTTTFPPVSLLTAAWLDGDRTVVFEDEYTMLGLMPDTCCLLDMAEWQGVSVDVSVEEASQSMFEVSCVMRNDGDRNVTFSGVTEDFWHIVVVRDNGCTFKPMDTILAPVVDTLAPGEELVFEPKLLNASGYPDGVYMVMAPMTQMNGVGAFTVEGNDYYVNTAPIDHGNAVSVDEESGVVTIELLRCCDVEDRVDDLLVRWDWESDGTWDTDYLPDRSVTRTFGDPDHVSVTYEITDSDGAVTQGTASYTVERGDGILGTPSAVLLIVATVAVVLIVVLLAVLLKRKR